MRILAGFIVRESKVLTQARGHLRRANSQGLAVLLHGFRVAAQCREDRAVIGPGVEAIGRNPQNFFIRLESARQIAGLMTKKCALPQRLDVFGVSTRA